MNRLRRQLHRWTWIALAAVLAIALAPSISHALAAGADHPWTEVCSAAGAPPSDGAPKAPGAQGHGDHCALCCQLGSAPLLPAGEPSDLDTASAPWLGLPESSPPFARLAWRAAQPRGPPAHA